MTDFDLEALSLKDLRQLQKDLAKAISTQQDRQKAEADLQAMCEKLLANMVVENFRVVRSSDNQTVRVILFDHLKEAVQYTTNLAHISR